MKLYTMTRPSMPLTPACAPAALTLAPAALAVLPAAERALIPAQAVRTIPVLAAERAPVSWVHQAQVQAELARVLTLVDGINGTTGTSGFNGTETSTKRYADGGSGVPPRGRPV